MSKYYKAEDVEREIERLLRFKEENDFDFGVKHGIETLERALKDLPTISEVSEDCISREYLEEQYWQTLTPNEMINTDVEIGINIGIKRMYDALRERKEE